MSRPPPNSIFLFAGEQSGDLYGSLLLSALKKKYPMANFFGVAGPQMRKEGLETLLEMEQFQVMGFSAVIKNFRKLFSHFRFLKKWILDSNPSMVILIDYPGFNLKMASALRKKGFRGKIIHYICPSVWAWKKNRIAHLAKHLDLLLVIFPFEPKYFSQTSLKTIFVGHPLTSLIHHYPYQANWKNAFQFPKEKKCIALFPGSRPAEVKANLKLQLQAFEKINSENPHHFYAAISVARCDLLPLIESTINRYAKKYQNLIFLIPSSLNYEIMKEAFGAIAKSGTVTLELALHQVPTVVIYSLSYFNYFIAKNIFKIRLPYYCIVNIILEKKVFPEWIDYQIFPKQVAKSFLNLISKQREECSRDCAKLIELLQISDSTKAINEIDKIFYK